VLLSGFTKPGWLAKPVDRLVFGSNSKFYEGYFLWFTNWFSIVNGLIFYSNPPVFSRLVFLFYCFKKFLIFDFFYSNCPSFYELSKPVQTILLSFGDKWPVSWLIS
jgi:hypothetical protein